MTALILSAARLLSMLLFAVFCGAVFWGLLGLVVMLIEPKRGRE